MYLYLCVSVFVFKCICLEARGKSLQRIMLGCTRPSQNKKKEIKDYFVHSNAVHIIQCESAHYPSYCYSETSNPWPSGFCNNKCTILAKPIVIRQNQNPAQSKC